MLFLSPHQTTHPIREHIRKMTSTTEYSLFPATHNRIQKGTLKLFFFLIQLFVYFHPETWRWPWLPTKPATMVGGDYRKHSAHKQLRHSFEAHNRQLCPRLWANSRYRLSRGPYPSSVAMSFFLDKNVAFRQDLPPLPTVCGVISLINGTVGVSVSSFFPSPLTHRSPFNTHTHRQLCKKSIFSRLNFAFIFQLLSKLCRTVDYFLLQKTFTEVFWRQ